ncbi:hypothetical protein Droror1_Dr00009728 [Drosera rotundifolia]
MAITVTDIGDSTFIVDLDGTTIRTTVTSSASIVTTWITSILHIHRRRLHRLVVGLDIEWRPNHSPYHRNPVATLQLCVGRICLVYRILYANSIPRSLIEFLGDSDFTFVGVGIGSDVEKLEEDYGVWVERVVELGVLAEERGVDGVRRGAGLREMAMEVLGVDVVKPRWITMSRWDNEVLSDEQIGYAAVDAYASFEIGVRLDAFDY